MRKLKALVAGLIVIAAVRGAPATTPTTQPEDSGVRLVVVLVIDQFRTDFLTRLEPRFGADGFRRLMRDGATFVNAYFSQASSVTAAGHATIASGRLPRQHGIVANQWYLEPTAKKVEGVFTDREYSTIGEPPDVKVKGKSPRMMIGPALGDELKLADARSRVFSIAMKPRAAISMGGHRPDGCFWWSEDTGHWLTSTYYVKDVPTYVAEWNAREGSDRFAGQAWERMLPESAYAECWPLPDLSRGELFGLGVTFPHPLPKRASKPPKQYYEALEATPFGNDVTLEMAERIVRDEKLGGGAAIDLLCVSLSSFDVAGHIFGPQSAEMLDFTLWTDRQIGAFLAMLDQRVGLGRYVLALSADHGVSTPPPVAERIGFETGIVDMGELQKRLNEALREAMGSMPDDIGYVRSIEPPWVFMNPVVDRMDRAQRKKVFDTALGVIRRTPGLVNGMTSDEMTGPPPSPTDLWRWLAYRAYYPGRAGQIAIQFAPYWQKKTRDLAGHSGASNQERHVPIVLYGPGITPGRYFAPADPLDIVPTISAMIGVEPVAGTSGRVLSEALDTTPR